MKRLLLQILFSTLLCSVLLGCATSDSPQATTKPAKPQPLVFVRVDGRDVGTIPWTKDTTLIGVVSQVPAVQSIQERARAVHVVRPDGRTFTINFRSLLVDLKKDPVLQPGDTIDFPRRAL